MKAKVIHPQPVKEMLELATRLEGHFQSDAPVLAQHLGEYGAQSGGHWNREGSFLAALGLEKSEGILCQVDPASVYHGFPQAAAGVHSDEETVAEPLWFFLDACEENLELGVGDLGFFGGRVLLDAQVCQRIGEAHFEADRLLHNQGERLNLVDGGIARRDLAGSLLKGGAPINVCLSVLIADSARRPQVHLAQEETDPLPAGLHTLKGYGVSVMVCEKLGNELPSLAFLCFTIVCQFLLGPLGTEDSGGGGFFCVFGSVAGGFAFPGSGFVEVAQIPKWGARLAVKGCHKIRVVSVCNKCDTRPQTSSHFPALTPVNTTLNDTKRHSIRNGGSIPLTRSPSDYEPLTDKIGVGEAK